MEDDRVHSVCTAEKNKTVEINSVYTEIYAISSLLITWKLPYISFCAYFTEVSANSSNPGAETS